MSQEITKNNPANDGASADCSDVNRRTALGVVFGGMGALMLGAASLALGFVSNALGRKKNRDWLRIGPAEDLDTESFQRHVLHVEHQHAWIRQRQPTTIYIRDQFPEDPIVLLSTCSHLGCSVKWEGEKGRFRCPCHGGIYDDQGQVVSGPPPKPLTRLDVKIEGEVCFVRLPGNDDDQESAST